MFKTYPNSFNSKSKASLETLVKNESKINYKTFSYKILFPDGKFHKISSLKKYGTLYSLIIDLVTRKTTVNSANADQISFIINLMHGIISMY